MRQSLLTRVDALEVKSGESFLITVSAPVDTTDEQVQAYLRSALAGFDAKTEERSLVVVLKRFGDEADKAIELVECTPGGVGEMLRAIDGKTRGLPIQRSA